MLFATDTVLWLCLALVSLHIHGYSFMIWMIQIKLSNLKPSLDTYFWSRYNTVVFTIFLPNFYLLSSYSSYNLNDWLIIFTTLGLWNLEQFTILYLPQKRNFVNKGIKYFTRTSNWQLQLSRLSFYQNENTVTMSHYDWKPENLAVNIDSFENPSISKYVTLLMNPSLDVCSHGSSVIVMIISPLRKKAFYSQYWIHGFTSLYVS